MRATRVGSSIEFLQGSTSKADLRQSVVELRGIFPRLPSLAFDFVSCLGLLRKRFEIGQRGLVGALSLLVLPSCHGRPSFKVEFEEEELSGYVRRCEGRPSRRVLVVVG